MMKLKCDDVMPGLGCDFVAEGATKEEVVQKMMEHGNVVHADLMEGKSEEEQKMAMETMKETMMAKISEE